jgi:hypothetical protein
MRCSVGACPRAVPATPRFLRRRRVRHGLDVVRGVRLLPRALRQNHLPEQAGMPYYGRVHAGQRSHRSYAHDGRADQLPPVPMGQIAHSNMSLESQSS